MEIFGMLLVIGMGIFGMLLVTGMGIFGMVLETGIGIFGMVLSHPEHTLHPCAPLPVSRLVFQALSGVCESFSVLQKVLPKLPLALLYSRNSPSNESSFPSPAVLGTAPKLGTCANIQAVPELNKILQEGRSRHTQEPLQSWCIQALLSQLSNRIKATTEMDSTDQ
ncbi:hypothetical protein TURU_027743 [Turdus rufiventris]|nr:hypothetical protein TURU_027743 [Turdus rufiventris]